MQMEKALDKENGNTLDFSAFVCKAVRFDGFFSRNTVPTENSEETRLSKKVRIGQLFQTYGSLLTDRQNEFVRLHHNEDLSFGEIAREFGVSRQAVHDAVSQAEAAMEHYEACLGLLTRPGANSTLAVPLKASGSAEIVAVTEQMNQLRRKLATQGIVYDTGEYVRALDEMLDQLTKAVGGKTAE